MAAFVDTNILIYAFADTSGGSLDKVAIARSLVASLFEQNELILSAQVLSEFSVTALSKVKPPLTIGQINERVLELSTQTVVPIDASLVQFALQRSETSRISYWDVSVPAQTLSTPRTCTTAPATDLCNSSIHSATDTPDAT